MELQVNSKNKRKVFLDLYISGILFWGLLIFFLCMLSSLRNPVHPLGPWLGFGIVSFYFLFIDIGPGIYLYKEYIHYNRDSILSVDPQSRKLSYELINRETIRSGFDEIKEIIIYIPPNNYRNTVTFTSMEDFSYARFELKDGRAFYVTCLMVPKLKLKDFIQKNLSRSTGRFPSLVDISRQQIGKLLQKKKPE